MTLLERQLLTLLESAQTKLGEAVELIVTTPHLQGSYRDASRKLADLILRLQNIVDDITAQKEKSA